MMLIIPAILTNDSKELEEKIRLVEGLVERVQIDIVDGIFADNKTIGIEELDNLKTDTKLDIQLMVKEPIGWVDKLVNLGVERIIGHIEMMRDQGEFVEKVKSAGQKAGLGIDLFTSVQELSPLVLPQLDVVLVMSVKAGFGGQEFETRVLEKVIELLSYKVNKGYKYKICVDGGIDKGNIKSVEEAGADEVAVGHSLYDGNIEDNLKLFKISDV